jgi:hypothetical protein
MASHPRDYEYLIQQLLLTANKEGVTNLFSHSLEYTKD